MSSGHLSGRADAIIIIPPFMGTERPHLGAHILQSCCAEKGLEVKVVYANLAMAAEIGEDVYEGFWDITGDMLGERFFSSAAFGLPLEDNLIECVKSYLAKNASPFKKRALGATKEELDKIERFWRGLAIWVDTFVDNLLKNPCPVIGCTSSFEQTAASVAFLKCVKKHDQRIITILGGANCEGDMGMGMRSLSHDIDYVFSGESERTLPIFLKAVLERKLPEDRVIHSEPCGSLDEIPPPKYSEYYRQHRHYLPKSGKVEGYQMILPYETSRGCAWGQTQKCTFCGLNGENLKYRVKSEEKVVVELKQLLQEHPSRKVAMTDNAFPLTYFQNLAPLLGDKLPGLNVAYQIRPNITFAQMCSLQRAGILQLQPGIETLSTSLLSRMNKGFAARHNIMFLRYARSLGISCNWNLLLAFPGDMETEYEETLRTLNAIPHLEPPRNISSMTIDRFSEYYNFPKNFGIRNLRPAGIYSSWLPAHADVTKLAYHFVGDFEHFAQPENEIIRRIYGFTEKWQDAWRSGLAARCELVKVAADKFLLIDTRGLVEGSSVQTLSKRQAKAALTNRQKHQKLFKESDLDEEEIRWALDRLLLLDLDGWYVSLVTASPDLITDEPIGHLKIEHPTC
jgi:ribosomal peptide maturation radical SAM protein 1